MGWIDGTIFALILGLIIWDGLRRARRNESEADWLLAGRVAPWWVMGLSVMATQASAITMVGTTGKGWEDGTRFVQFYYALPLAMVILAFTLAPLFHRYRVFTAYEYLGIRFDRKTRLLSALIFLCLRLISASLVIYAPATLLARIFGLPTSWMISAVGVLALIYTAWGGMKAVLATDVKQMAIMVVGLIAALIAAIASLPEGVGVSGAHTLTDAAGRWVLADTSWDPSERYTIWSSLLGGTFLFLAYFGCDQSQAQRFFAGRSLRDVRGALFLNAVCKVPFQLLVLILGSLIFVSSIYQAPVATYVPELEAGAHAVEGRLEPVWSELRRSADVVLATEAGTPARAEASEHYRAAIENAKTEREALRAELAAAAGLDPNDTHNRDDNYVFPHFVLHFLPIGLIGLIFAAIFAAALSSIDSELNAMATVVIIDGYHEGLRKPRDETPHSALHHGVTIALGVIATGLAFYAEGSRSVVEAVNELGSYFYGPLLGVFALAAVRRAHGHGAFVGLIIGMSAVFTLDRSLDLAFVYRNTVGTVATFAGGVIVSLLVPPAEQPTSE